MNCADCGRFVSNEAANKYTSFCADNEFCGESVEHRCERCGKKNDLANKRAGLTREQSAYFGAGGY